MESCCKTADIWYVDTKTADICGYKTMSIQEIVVMAKIKYAWIRVVTLKSMDQNDEVVLEQKVTKCAEEQVVTNRY